MSPGQSTEEPRLLQWIQHQAGLSRRKAQELIAAGEVALDGRVVSDPFLRIRPESLRTVALRGHPLATVPPEPRIYRYHKPAGVLCSHDDPHAGNTVGRALRAEGFIGYTWAGRLDRDAEGLLLVTNDGDLVQAFSHPRYRIEKTYHVWIRKAPIRKVLERHLEQMQRGIEDAGETLRIVGGQVREGRPYVELRLAEGRKHEIKRLFGHFRLELVRLQRVSMGPIDLADLPAGAFRRLRPDEEERAFTAARSALEGI